MFFNKEKTTMVERRFPGDPVIPETGVGDGKAAPVPLTMTQQRVTEELLNQDGDKDPKPEAELQPRRGQRAAAVQDDIDDDDLDEADETAPKYAREQVGSRIGLPLDEANAVNQIEERLDQEDVVPCLFQKEVRVQDKGLMHTWGPGIHLVPVSLAGDGTKEKPMHFYLRANRVKRTGKPQPRALG
jgi:hypothetical protein